MNGIWRPLRSASEGDANGLGGRDLSDAEGIEGGTQAACGYNCVVPMRSRLFASAFVLLLGLTPAIRGQGGTPVLPVVTGCTQSPGAGSTLAITVFGTGFLPDSTLRWNGSPLTATAVSATQLTASVPASLVSGTDSATVSAVSGGIISNCVSISVPPPPVIISASPNRVDAGGASFTVSVLGTGFLPGSVVKWAGASLATNFPNAGQLSALVPAGLIASSGAYSLTVVTPDGTVSNSFGIIVQPVVTAITPNFAAVGASDVTITATGAGFVSTDVLVISQSNTRLNLLTTNISATTLTAVVPPAMLVQAVQATIFVSDTAAGDVFSRELPFTIGRPPAITSLNPASAIAGGPSFTLVVWGSGFLPGAAVQWDGAPLPTAFVSDTQLTASVAAVLIAVQRTVGTAVTVPGGISNTVIFDIRLPTPFTATAGVVNAASGLPSIAPGSLISIYGVDLAAGSGAAGSIPLPTSLNETSVTINGVLAPLLFTSPTQINAQVPFETPVGNATLVAVVAGQKSAAVTFNVTATGPGVLMQPQSNHAVAQNYSDWSVNAPQNAAAPGQYVVVYLTGQGLVDNPVATGAAPPASPPSVPLAAAQAKIGGSAADIQFLGLAPGLVGVSQMNLLIPVVGAGEQLLEVSIGGVAANTSTLSVQAQ